MARARLCRATEASTGAVVADRLRVADTHWTRLRGLIGSRELAAGEGLWIRPCRQVHMFWMRYPIDVLFLDSEGRVIALHHRLPPNRFSRLVPRAEGVLELPASTLESTGTNLGDTVCFVGGRPKN